MALRNMSKSSGSESHSTLLRCTSAETGIDIDPDVHSVRIDRDWSLPKPCTASGNTNSRDGKGLIWCPLLVCCSATVAGWREPYIEGFRSCRSERQRVDCWFIHHSFTLRCFPYLGAFASDPCTCDQQLTVVGRRLPKSSSTQQETLLRAFAMFSLESTLAAMFLCSFLCEVNV